MLASQISAIEGFQSLTEKNGPDQEITGVYIGDLLSWVMGRARAGQVWITIQGHLNVVAVAVLVGISGIILVEGAEMAPEALKQAERERILVFQTAMTAYEAAKIFAELGVA